MAGEGRVGNRNRAAGPPLTTDAVQPESGVRHVHPRSSTPSAHLSANDEDSTRIYASAFEVTTFLSEHEDGVFPAQEQWGDADDDVTRAADLTPLELETLRGHLKSKDNSNSQEGLPSAPPSAAVPQSEITSPMFETHTVAEAEREAASPARRPPRREIASWLAFMAGVVVCACGMLVLRPQGDELAEQRRDRDLTLAPPPATNLIFPFKDSPRTTVALASPTPQGVPVAEGTQLEVLAHVDGAPPPSNAESAGGGELAAPEPTEQPGEDALQPGVEPAQAANEPVDEASALPATPDSGKTVLGAGFLHIKTRPIAEIYIDGQLVGQTPQKRLKLAAGRHELTLKNSERNLSRTSTIVIVPGRIVKRLVDL